MTGYQPPGRSVHFNMNSAGENGYASGSSSSMRYRKTPYMDRTQAGRKLTNGGAGGEDARGQKLGSGVLDIRRSVKPRQAIRSHSRWSDLVTKRILNNMQEQMRTPMQVSQ